MHSHSEKDFQAFLCSIAIPLGDQKARLALAQEVPDLETAHKGFIQGGNLPEDVPGMIRLYRYFGATPLFSESVSMWAAADTAIERLYTMGQEVHQKITSGTWSESDFDHYHRALRDINEKVTPLEVAFSTAIANSSEQAKRLIFALLAGLTTVLAGLGVFFSRRLAAQRFASLQTAHKYAEKQHALLRNASDGIHIVDTQGKITEASDSFCAMLGYEHDEVIGMNLDQVEARHGPEEIARLMKSIASDKARFQVETLHRRKDGSHLEVELTVMPVTLDDQVVLFSSSRDITERRLAEQQRQTMLDTLTRERSFLKTLVGTLPDLIWLKDPEGVYLTCNPEFERFFGASESAIVGKTDYDFVDRELADFFRQNDRQAIARGGPSVNEEWVTYASDGRRVLLQTTKTPMLDARQQVIGVLGIGHDITELKQFQEELVMHRTRLEELVEARTHELTQTHRELADNQYAMDKVGIGITRVNMDTGQIIYSNAYAAQLLGYTQEEMCSLTVPDIDPDFPPERHTEVVALLRQLGQIKFETSQLTKDGHRIPVEVAIYCHNDETGPSAHCIVFQVDISERKQAQQALVEAKEAAESASRAKSQFLANMSHEIRTPMNGVIGMSDVLLRTQLSDQQHKMAEIIRESAQTQLGILNDILDFSKIEADRLDLSLEPFGLAELIDKTCATLTDHAQTKDVTVHRVMDPDIPKALEGDALRVRQILANFLSNAIKFSSGLERPGIVEVRARFAGESDGRIWVELSVSDNGVGMDAATRQRIFHPFTQADASTTRKYGGTGLGLVISARLAEAMQGEIRVESTLGTGSTFTVRLPFAPTDEDKLAAATDTNELSLPQEPVPSRDQDRRQGRLILVAEDNDTNQEVIRQQLGMIGYQCDVAADGREAFKLWLSGDFGLVLSDIHMPRMDGYLLAEAIRSEESRAGKARTPILALTANVMKGEAERCQAMGMDGYLAKPVPLSQLMGSLVNWLPTQEPGPGELPTPERSLPGETRKAEADIPAFEPGMLTRMVGDNPRLTNACWRNSWPTAGNRQCSCAMPSKHAIPTRSACLPTV